MKKGKIMKICALTLALSALTSMSAFASNAPGVGPGSMSFKEGYDGKFGLTMDYDAVVKPTYTVIVPQTLGMEKDGTDVYVEVKDSKNLAENKKYLSVKLLDTWANGFPKAYRDDAHKFNLYKGYNFMSFKIQPKTGDAAYGDALTDFGQEILSFTEDARKYYRVIPGDDNTLNGTYWGAMHFQIGLADVEADA